MLKWGGVKPQPTLLGELIILISIFEHFLQEGVRLANNFGSIFTRKNNQESPKIAQNLWKLEVWLAMLALFQPLLGAGRSSPSTIKIKFLAESRPKQAYRLKQSCRPKQAYWPKQTYMPKYANRPINQNWTKQANMPKQANRPK